jgi:hypothetical protein
MNWTDLNLFVSAVFITGVTVVAGSIAVAGSWIAVISSNRDGTLLGPLHTFTIAVTLDVVALPVLWLVADNVKTAVWLGFLLVAFGFVIGTVVLEYRSPRRLGRRLLRLGSVIVLTANVVGFAWLLLS